MDTPERTSQIGTPKSKTEESPFSNFANTLSPINSMKTLNVSQTFNSLSFTSPPSVFTSPHVSLQKESRFLLRHQASDLAKTHFSCDEANQVSQAGEAIRADEQQPDQSTNEYVEGEGVSGTEAVAEPLCNVSERPTELQNVLKYDSGSPDSRTATSCGTEQNCEPGSSGALVPYVQDPPADGSFGPELNTQERGHDNEEAACDWQSLISGTTDMLVFYSPNAPTIRGSFQKSLENETDVFASLLSRFPPSDSNDAQNSHPADTINHDEDQEATNQATLRTETNEFKQTDQQPGNLSISSLDRYVAGDSGEKSGDEPFPHMQRGMRRRCLTFEMPKAKSNVNNVIFPSSSSTLQNEEKSLPNDRQPLMPSDSSRCFLAGFGLHLNKVTQLSKKCRVSHQENTSPPNQGPLTKLSAPTASETNVNPTESGLQLAEDSSQPSAYVATEELNPNSPKKKRCKVENVGEVKGCKRCNCKKSKCLKLYCECFAAGVYCVEPCSCQECFNKPIHEDTVLATRKQIESRNPLAFAPKVIRNSAQDFGDVTKTPASARHKRGCNCKKSNCLKKYCECYQGGVGCSISCRCEGCKNAFGRKDGLSLQGSESEIEEAQGSKTHITDKSLDPAAFHDDEDQNSDFNLPKTPLKMFRSSIPLLTSAKGKPPISLATIGSSMSLHPIDGPGRSTFLRSQLKVQKQLHGGSGDEIPTVLRNCSPPSDGVKALSPNGKRVSPPQDSNGQSPIMRSSRKLILQSIPSFPSLTPRR